MTVGSKWRAARPLIAVLAPAILLGCLGDRPTGHRRPVRAGATRTPVAEPPGGVGVERVEYEWSDPNTERILEWRGDTRIVERGGKGRRFRQTFRVDLARLRRAVDAFGIPQSWKTIRYHSPEDLERKTAEVVARSAARGIAYAAEDGNSRVDYSWVVDNSRADLAEASGQLRALAREAGESGERETTGLVASFVQGLEYRVPPEWRTGANGERTLTGGIALPLETLRNGWGDCDTKSLLFATLLAAARGPGAIFLQGEQHLFVGVRVPPRPYDHVVRLRGIPYVLVEVTDSWPLGRVPVRLWNGVQAGLFRVIPIPGVTAG